MPLLAVYGTLRKGFRNHRLLKGARLVWEGFAELPYELVVNEDCIPYLVPAEKPRRIYVEVYEVSDDLLRELDAFEDVPREYLRVEVYVHPVGFAHIYVARGGVHGEVVDYGDFLGYAREKGRCRYLLEG